MFIAGKRFVRRAAGVTAIWLCGGIMLIARAAGIRL
jgi:hypothetical protein